MERFVWTQVDELKRDFGVYGQPLGPGSEYREFNAVYEEGAPHRFWLRVLLASAVLLTEFYLIFPDGFSSRAVADRIRSVAV
jgi:hypothetical protein